MKNKKRRNEESDTEPLIKPEEIELPNNPMMNSLIYNVRKKLKGHRTSEQVKWAMKGFFRALGFASGIGYLAHL